MEKLSEKSQKRQGPIERVDPLLKEKLRKLFDESQFQSNPEERTLLPPFILKRLFYRTY